MDWSPALVEDSSQFHRPACRISEFSCEEGTVILCDVIFIFEKKRHSLVKVVTHHIHRNTQFLTLNLIIS